MSVCVRIVPYACPICNVALTAPVEGEENLCCRCRDSLLELRELTDDELKDKFQALPVKERGVGLLQKLFTRELGRRGLLELQGSA